MKYFILNIWSVIIWLLILSFTDASAGVGNVILVYMMAVAIPHAIMTGILGTLWDKYSER